MRNLLPLLEASSAVARRAPRQPCIETFRLEGLAAMEQALR